MLWLTVLEIWKKPVDVCNSDGLNLPGAFTKVTKSQVNQNLSMTSLPSIPKLMDVVSIHGKYCKGIQLTPKKSHRERSCLFFEIDLLSGRHRTRFPTFGHHPLIYTTVNTLRTKESTMYFYTEECYPLIIQNFVIAAL